MQGGGDHAQSMAEEKPGDEPVSERGQRLDGRRARSGYRSHEARYHRGFKGAAEEATAAVDVIIRTDYSAAIGSIARSHR